MTPQSTHAPHPPHPNLAPPFPGAPEYMTTCRELAPRLLTLQAERDAMAVELDETRRDLVRVGRENDGLRAMVVKLREKIGWLESELERMGRDEPR